jgi:hypothetical protein
MFAWATLTASALAQTPPLLAEAFKQWSAGAGDVAFTQRTRAFLDDGSIEEEHTERFDPSLPDRERWRLVEVDGKPATDEQRKKWEARKNAKPRKAVGKSLTDYLDIEHATLAKDTPATARFEVGVRPEAARLLAVEDIKVFVTIEKEHGGIAHISAALRKPIRVLLGLANITDFDLDVGIDPLPGDSDPTLKSGAVNADSSARVKMFKLGFPVEYRWSDFKRVASHSEARKVSLAETKPMAEPVP